MNKTKKIALIIIGVAVLALVSTLVFFGSKNKKEKYKEETVERYVVPARESVFINGVISPRKEQIVSTDLMKGKVEKIHIEDGAEVKKDDPLITYRKEEISEQISELNTQISDIKEAKKAEKIALEKQQSLKINDVDGLEGPEASALDSTADYDLQIKKMERQITELKKKEFLVEHSKLDGKVSLEKDQMEDGREGTKIVVQSYDFVVLGNVNEVDLFKLKKGMNVEIMLVADENKIIGKIENISQKPSTESGGEMMIGSIGDGNSQSSFSEYPVTFIIDDQEGLAEGFHVQVKVPYGKDEILIPETALIKENNKTYVFLIKDDIIKKHEIQIGEKREEYIVVTKGLKENDEIVAKVIEGLEEGAKIE